MLLIRSKIPFWLIVSFAIAIIAAVGCAPGGGNNDSDDTAAEDDDGGAPPLTALLDGVEVEIPNPLATDDLPAPSTPTAPTPAQITAATETWDAKPTSELDDLQAAEDAADLSAGEIAAITDYFSVPVPPNPY